MLCSLSSRLLAGFPQTGAAEAIRVEGARTLSRPVAAEAFGPAAELPAAGVRRACEPKGV